MGNMLIAYPNHVDSTYYGVLFTSGSWAAASPLTNLADPLLSKKAVSSNLLNTSTQFEVYMGASRNAQAFIIPAHNITKKGRARTRASNKQAFIDVTVGASGSSGASSVTLQTSANTRARIKSGDLFKIGNSSTVYRATSELNVGNNMVLGGSDPNIDGWATNTDTELSVNVTTAPDAQMNGAKLVTTNSPDETHFAIINLYYNGMVSPVNYICHSVFLKACEYTKARLTVERSYVQFSVDIDLATGAVSNPQSTTHALDNAIMYAYGAVPIIDGWYRCYIVTYGDNSLAYGAEDIIVNILDANGDHVFDGDGSRGIYIAYADCEEGAKEPTRLVKRVANASIVYSGTVSITPNLTADITAGSTVSCLSGDFFSYQPLFKSEYKEVWQRAYSFGSLPFGHPSFGDGKVSDEETRLYAFPYVEILPAPINAFHWLCEIDDTSNPDGAITLSRLFIGPVYTPEFNIDFGASIGWTDETDITKSLGGAEFYNNLSKGRSFRGALTNLSWDEGLQNMFDIQRLAGVDKQMFVMFDKNDTIHLHRRAFLATFRTLSQLEFPNFDRAVTAVEFKEVKG